MQSGRRLGQTPPDNAIEGDGHSMVRRPTLPVRPAGVISPATSLCARRTSSGSVGGVGLTPEMLPSVMASQGRTMQPPSQVSSVRSIPRRSCDIAPPAVEFAANAVERRWRRRIILHLCGASRYNGLCSGIWPQRFQRETFPYEARLSDTRVCATRAQRHGRRQTLRDSAGVGMRGNQAWHYTSNGRSASDQR